MYTTKQRIAGSPCCRANVKEHSRVPKLYDFSSSGKNVACDLSKKFSTKNYLVYLLERHAAFGHRTLRSTTATRDRTKPPVGGGCHHHPRSVRKISGHRPGRAMIFGSLYTDNLSADQYAGARDPQHDVSSLSRSCVQNNIYHRWRRPCDWDGGLYQTLINAPFSKAC